MNGKAKMITYGDEARRSIFNGVEKLNKAVSATLGPRGRNVIIGTDYGFPIITKDGVTVAREIFLEDKYENLGAQIVKEVATRTNDVAGDGTTTATLLATSIYRDSLKNVTAGANPMSLKRGIDKAVTVVVDYINSVAQPVQSKKEISQVASISANNDQEIGDLIAEAMEKVGNDGVVTLEEAGSIDTTLTVVEGMQFDRGWISQYMINDPELMGTSLDNPVVFIYDGKLSSSQDAMQVMEIAAKMKKHLLIIADDVDGEALATIVVNCLKRTITCAAVKAPGFGDRRKAIMEDIATLTGGTVVSEEAGMSISDMEESWFGGAKKILVDRESTTIVEGKNDPVAVQGRIAFIKKQLDNTKSDYDREKLQDRIAKLSGGIAVINIGAATEIELREKRMRLEDALSATRAAIAEGIVTGGGITFIHAQDKVKAFADTLQGDEKIGALIVHNAIESPLKQIVDNAGQEGSVIVKEAKGRDITIGYNAYTLEWENMFESGIVDPAKVVRSALQNAASVAGLLCTTEVLIEDKPVEDNSSIANSPSSQM